MAAPSNTTQFFILFTKEFSEYYSHIFIFFLFNSFLTSWDNSFKSYDAFTVKYASFNSQSNIWELKYKVFELLRDEDKRSPVWKKHLYNTPKTDLRQNNITATRGRTFWIIKLDEEKKQQQQ